MATTVITGKRKRADAPSKTVQFKKAAISQHGENPKKNSEALPLDTEPRSGVEKATTKPPVNVAPTGDVHVQIVTGSYERVLHGICATIPQTSLCKRPSESKDEDQETDRADKVTFSDTFLFAAHASSIRCLALSPPTDSDKRMLATGSSDERINLYSISTAPPPSRPGPKPLSLVSSTPTAENSRNRSLGNLIHHDRAITALHFPSKSKLFSAAEDNTLAISRTRDWTMLSSIRAPISKPQGRPSGDTAAPGEVPAGVNDFAIHPSQRLMLSVGRGERCMRLWNLMTGKKAGVLQFEREVLALVGEGRHGTGEGRKVLWNARGEVFVVGFERGAVVFGIDSKARAVVKPPRPTKIHQMRFLPGEGGRILAVSAEDGSVLFFDLGAVSEEADVAELGACPCIAELGGRAAGLSGRVKDFEVLSLRASMPEEEAPLLLVTGSSDGAVRLWTAFPSELAASSGGEEEAQPLKQCGRLIATLETSNRITCLGAFVLDGKATADGQDVVKNGAEDSDGSGSEAHDSE